jgi:hypothetical protein
MEAKNPAGYSGTPLARKLGIKNGFKVRLVNRPENYYQMFKDFPEDVTEVEDRKTLLDFVHYFGREADKLDRELEAFKKQLQQEGMIWISWPKKSSGVKTDLNGNVVRAIGLKHGLVDIKVCSVNEIWSALKFVIPVKDRK